MSSEAEFPAELVAVDERAQEFHLAEYWAAIVRRWRLVALCLGIALTVAALYSILTQPLYRAAAVLDLEPEKADALDIGIGSAPTAYYYFVRPEFLATQSKLMKTSEMAERVVKRLNLVENRQFNPRKSGFFKGERKPEAGEEFAGVVGTLMRSIDAKPVRDVGVTTRDTNLVELSVVAPSGSLAADIANAVAEAYLAWDVESKYGPVGRASGYLAAQIQQTRSELDAKAQQVLAYGREKDIVSTDSQANLYAQKVDLNLDAAVAERVAKEARYRDVQTAAPESVADTLASGLVSQLRAEQARLERDYAEKLNLFKPDWPAMRQLKAQIDSGREHLASVIGETVAKARDVAKNDYLTALRKEESLKAAMKSQRTEIMKFNSDVVGYNSLKLEVDIKRALLDTLLKRQAEVEVMSRLATQRQSSIRIAERARPPHRPFRPSYSFNGLLALLLGGAVGIGLALLLEYFDRSLRTAEQVEKHIQLPALGVIPAVGTAAGKSYGYSGKLRRKRREGPEEEVASIELLPHQHFRSRVAERYRAFRTALLLSRAGGVKSIVITSSFSREGKTATAVNLAVVLGQLGKRVLLVDADLHRPRLHEVFRLSNRTGLVSVLAENLNPDRAIANTDVPDVLVVPSGPSSPNPSGLLSSEAMSNFLEFARLNFDYIIIDAPPVAACSPQQRGRRRGRIRGARL